MSVSDLTRGSIDQMITHYDPSNKVDNPVLQILSIKKLAPSQPGNAERYRVILSDGVHYCQSESNFMPSASFTTSRVLT